MSLAVNKSLSPSPVFFRRPAERLLVQFLSDASALRSTAVPVSCDASFSARTRLQTVVDAVAAGANVVVSAFSDLRGQRQCAQRDMSLSQAGIGQHDAAAALLLRGDTNEIWLQQAKVGTT